MPARLTTVKYHTAVLTSRSSRPETPKGAGRAIAAGTQWRVTGRNPRTATTHTDQPTTDGSTRGRARAAHGGGAARRRHLAGGLRPHLRHQPHPRHPYRGRRSRPGRSVTPTARRCNAISVYGTPAASRAPTGTGSLIALCQWHDKGRLVIAIVDDPPLPLGWSELRRRRATTATTPDAAERR